MAAFAHWGCARVLSAAFYPAPASAQYYGFGYRPWHRPPHRALKHTSKDAGKVSQDPFGNMPKGPLQIFISIDQQKLHLYSDGMHVADTSVATGVPSLPTPLGVFSVIQKQVFHRSNIYSNAPMPFMQRITWSGVAMHEGEGIGHRASHGCIRMPHDFAVRLYHLTKLGVPVIVARQELKPAAFADPISSCIGTSRRHRPRRPRRPFRMRRQPQRPTMRRRSCRPPRTPPRSGCGSALTVPPQRLPPWRMPRNPIRSVSDAPQPAASPAKLTIDANGAASPDREDGSTRFLRVCNRAGSTCACTCRNAKSRRAPCRRPSRRTCIKAAPASKAPIAIFVSRKEKKIYVRQDFAPLFQAPVTITDPDKPLGTHVFTALGFAGDDHGDIALGCRLAAGRAAATAEAQGRARNALRQICRRQARPRGIRKAHRATAAADAGRGARAHRRSRRAAIDYISALIVPGSSLIVSDHGLGEETGEGTNFIVVTR